MREGRKYCQFGDIASFSRGLTFAKGDVAAESTKKVLRSNNIDLDSHSLNLDDIACLNEDFDIPDDKKLHRGDVFVCMSNGSTQHLGKVAFIEEDMDYAFGGFMGAIHPDSSRIYPKYVYYSCISSEYRRFLASIFNGVNINNLKWSELSKFSIPFPSLSEQERIVAELDLLTGIIDKQKQQFKELDTLAQSIFYDIFGDPVENEKGWDVCKLGEVCVIERGGSPRPIEQYLTDDENGINWVKIGDATDGGMVITSTKQKIRPEGMKKSRFVHKGDFLLSNSMSFGKPYILGVDGCIHDGWLVIQDTNHVFNKIYLYYFLGSPQTYKAFQSMAVGGVVNNLNKDIVKALQIAIPSSEIQEIFAQKIQSIESQKTSINRSIAETQKLFDYTMDKYFG